jgi:hypothetical protein
MAVEGTRNNDTLVLIFAAGILAILVTGVIPLSLALAKAEAQKPLVVSRVVRHATPDAPSAASLCMAGSTCERCIEQSGRQTCSAGMCNSQGACIPESAQIAHDAGVNVIGAQDLLRVITS